MVTQMQGFGVFSKDEIINHGSKHGLMKEDYKYLGPLIIMMDDSLAFLSIEFGQIMKFDQEKHFVKYHKNQ